MMQRGSQFNLTRPDSHRQNSPNYLSQLGGERVPYHGRGTGLNTDISAASGHFGYDVDATTDISNFRPNSGERKHSGDRNHEFEMRN